MNRRRRRSRGDREGVEEDDAVGGEAHVGEEEEDEVTVAGDAVAMQRLLRKQLELGNLWTPSVRWRKSGCGRRGWRTGVGGAVKNGEDVVARWSSREEGKHKGAKERGGDLLRDLDGEEVEGHMDGGRRWSRREEGSGSRAAAKMHQGAVGGEERAEKRGGALEGVEAKGSGHQEDAAVQRRRCGGERRRWKMATRWPEGRCEVAVRRWRTGELRESCSGVRAWPEWWEKGGGRRELDAGGGLWWRGEASGGAVERVDLGGSKAEKVAAHGWHAGESARPRRRPEMKTAECSRVGEGGARETQRKCRARVFPRRRRLG